MALKSDNLGFLTGEPVEWGKAISIWGDIRNDVSEIRRSINGNVGFRPIKPSKAANDAVIPAIKMHSDAALNRMQRSVTSSLMDSKRTVDQYIKSIPSRKRDSSGRFVPSTDDQVSSSIKKSSKSNREMLEKINRSANGRFEKSGSAAGDGRFMSKIKSLFGMAANVGGSALNHDIDPTIAAANEARNILSPVGRAVMPVGRGMMRIAKAGFSSSANVGTDPALRVEKKKLAWYERIFGVLTDIRRSEDDQAKRKVLNALGDRTRASGSGSGSFFGSILSPLLSKLPIVGGLFGGGGGGMLGGVGGLLKGAGKGLGKRIPLLGSLLTLFGAGSDAMDIENDSSLNADQKKDAHVVNGSKTAGSIGGAVLGGAIGSMILPGIGTAVGAWLGSMGGEIIGEKVGGWINDLRKSDIAKTVSEGWSSMTSSISAKWDSAVSGMSQAWTSGISNMSGMFDAVSKTVKDFLKDKFGVDVDKTISDAKKSVSETIDKGVDFAKATATKAQEIIKPVIDKGVEVVSAGATKAQEMAKPAIDAASNTRAGKAVIAAGTAISSGTKKAQDWVLGQTSKLFESGSGGAGTVSSGKGDFGGASYGTYQLSSKTKTVDNFLKSSGYGDVFKGLTPGSKEFGEKWKEVAKSDPTFGDAQHDFVKKTHFDPAVEGLKKSGIDLSGRGSAVQDAIWSTSTQFGAGKVDSSSGAVGMFKSALKGKDVSKMTDADIVSAIQGYKIDNNDKLFSSSSSAVKMGTLARAKTEKDRLLSLVDVPPQANALNQSPLKDGKTPETAAPFPVATAPAAVSPATEQVKDIRKNGMTYDNSEYASLYKNKDGTQNTSAVIGGDTIASQISDKGIDPMSQQAMFPPSLPGAAPKYSEPPPPADPSKRAFAPIPAYYGDEDEDDLTPTTPAVANSEVTVYGSAPPQAVASIPAIPRIASAPKVPSAATVPEAVSPAVTSQIYGGGERGASVSVKLEKQDVGQDIRDRGIAHIATGGIAGGFRS